MSQENGLLCPNCGQPVSEEETICPACGEAIAAAEKTV
ncbi:MAG: zinc ribbon domain-containing protein [Patescibacteria group bacterium]